MPMNDTTYTISDIAARVRDMEQTQRINIRDEEDIMMTSTVIPELRFLFDTVKRYRKKYPYDSTQPDRFAEIETALSELELVQDDAIQQGKFVMLHSKIIPQMRFLLDDLKRMSAKRKKRSQEEDEENEVLTEPAAR